MSTTLRLELFVDDLERSISFYRDVLRFQVESRQEGYVSMRRGTVVLGLGPKANLPPGHHFSPDALAEHKGVGVEIVLEVEDVDGDDSRVQASGHPIAVPLGNRPWGRRDFRVVDPDGYYLRITS